MTPGFDLVIRAPRAVVGGAERPAAVGVREGRIAAVAPLDQAATAAEVIELTAGEVLLPGLVDTHVHVCEPRHADWEGFASIDPQARRLAGLRWFNALPTRQAVTVLVDGGLPAGRAAEIVSGRPLRAGRTGAADHGALLTILEGRHPPERR
ncbi:MAG TPA: hypothetical protein VF162_06975 [Streptosporangiaceae bacterium]